MAITNALLEHPDLDPVVKDCRGRTCAYWAARIGSGRNAIEFGAGESAKARINSRLSGSPNLVLHAAIASGKDGVVMEATRDMQNEDGTELDEDNWTASYSAARYKYKVKSTKKLEAKL